MQLALAADREVPGARLLRSPLVGRCCITASSGSSAGSRATGVPARCASTVGWYNADRPQSVSLLVRFFRQIDDQSILDQISERSDQGRGASPTFSASVTPAHMPQVSPMWRNLEPRVRHIVVVVIQVFIVQNNGPWSTKELYVSLIL